MKQCKHCSETNEENFYVGTQRGNNGQTWKYLDSICKICRKKYSLERRRQIKKEAVEYLGGQCTDCHLREKCYDVYDFHHVNPLVKEFSISKNAKSFTSLKNELDKCILLCSNCHRKRHAKIEN